MKRVNLFILLSVTCAFAACGGCDNQSSNSNNGTRADAGGVDASANNGAQTDGGGGPVIPGLTELRIEPGDQTIVDDGAAPGETASYKAIGVFGDEEKDVTDQVSWTLLNPDLGEIDKGAFTSAGIGGATSVIASTSEASADADLTVRLEVSATDTNAPATIPALFPADGANDVLDEAALLLVYPSHETMFPRNLERANYQWLANDQLDAFELHFESAVADIRFYTAGDQYLPDPAGWKWLADTHAGSSVKLTIRGTTQADATTIYRSQTIDIYFSEQKVLGALYYWSTGAQGVMKAHISSPTATKFYTDPATDDNTCTSCHTVSRNGTKLFVNYGGENAREVTIPEREVLIPPTPDAEEREGGWATFNPDATRLLYASKGVLWLLDADTGAEISQLELPEGFVASHPDWAPSGEYVAVAYGTSASNKSVSGTSLARIPVTGPDQFGAPEILIAASEADDETLYFPSYSPNSEYIAYVRTEGGSKDSEPAEIFLVHADGGEPIPLPRLNQRVRHEDGLIEQGNAMPTWAPKSAANDIYFLAISSLRAYGHIQDGGRDQLWGAGIDFSAIGTSDPSYAGFWMPFQSLDEGNHRAFWAIDTEEECPSDVEICDNIDNDCDGVVDEDCCMVSNEVCGDGVDNDCDGAVDEGCGCEDKEICGDGIDNDCDDMIDQNDIDCVIN